MQFLGFGKSFHSFMVLKSYSHIKSRTLRSILCFLKCANLGLKLQLYLKLIYSEAL